MPTNEGNVALNNYLQGKGRLSTLSWLDEPTGAQDAPVWKSTCKIAGEAIAVGTGSHKHIARNDAATKALEVIVKADNSN